MDFILKCPVSNMKVLIVRSVACLPRLSHTHTKNFNNYTRTTKPLEETSVLILKTETLKRIPLFHSSVLCLAHSRPIANIYWVAGRTVE